MKTIKIAKVPGVVKEVAVPAGATVQDILSVYTDELGESITGYEVRLGDSTASLTAVPEDGAKLYLVQQVKGNL